jgi:hypothetical protein
VEFYITLTNVLHVPDNHTNIVSCSRLMTSHLYLNSFEGCLNYHNPNGDGSVQRYCKPTWSHHFWWLQLDPRDKDYDGLGHRLTSAMVISASPTTWHQRLGHPSFNVTKKIAQRDPNIQIMDEQNLIGKHTIERSSPSACICCRIGKSTQHISHISMPRGRYPMEKLHGDVIFLEEAYNGQKFILHLLCDYSQWRELHFYHQKS